MSFLSPWSFALLGLAGPIIVLYFLKLKRKEVLVPSTFLWKKAINDLRVNAPFQRLRKNLLLFLQLLLLLLIVLALARPVARFQLQGGTKVVLILDLSGSMNASGDGKTRLDSAREAALGLVKELDRGKGSIFQASGEARQMMVISFSADRTVTHTGFTADTHLLTRIINEAMQPTDRATRIRETLAVAVSALKAENMEASPDKAEIVIISDGKFEGETEEMFDIPYPVRFLRMDQGKRNVAITQLDARKVQEGSPYYQIFVTIENFGAAAEKCLVKVSQDGTVLDAQEVSLDPKPREAKPASPGAGTPGAAPADAAAGPAETTAPKNRASPKFQGLRLQEGVVQVELDLQDDLAADNLAWTSIEKEREVSTVVVGPANPFLDWALKNLPHTRTSSAAEISEKELNERFAADEATVVFFNGKAPGKVPPGNYVFLGVENLPLPGFKTLEKKKFPLITHGIDRHPAVRHVDLSNVTVAEMFRYEHPPAAIPLVETDSTPLIFGYEDAGIRALIVACDPLQTDWPFKLSFPLFVTRAVQYMTSRDRRIFHAGETIPVAVPPSASAVSVLPPPSGAVPAKEISLPDTKTRERYFASTDRTGLYTLKIQGQKDRLIPVNLLNARESDIVVGERVVVGGRVFKKDESKSKRVALIWKYLGLAAVGLLLFEWWVYNKKVWL